MRWRPAYIGVGSNLESPADQVRSAISAIGRYRDTRLVLSSPQYRSSPMGPQDQPDFINAVVAVLTRLEPAALFGLMRQTEREHGRDRSSGHWGPRTLDLDLLSYASVELATEELTLPHPGIADRNFVLLPWSDIAPHYKVPGLLPVARLAEDMPREPVIRKEG
jgi:2-amino-4-hydroxy-6-hydroxymethyldihydropteridine diphosphokinase